MENKQKSKKLWTIITIISLLLFLFSATILIIKFWPQGEIVKKPNLPDSNSQQELPDNPKNFAELKNQSSDIVGWIAVPGTVIDYPVMRSGEEREENFYINKDINGNYKQSGSIYMQKISQPDFSDPNTVLYGHNMKNGTMFGPLHKFKNKTFFEENQYIYIYIPEKVLTYKIYSVFVYDNRHILNSFNFYNKDDFNKYLQFTLNPISMTKNVRKGVNVTTDDKIITLSTCTGDDTKRLILEGVLVDVLKTK